ncbi:unnamed protein product [Acanthoscelides obtectus]|uniref:Uncharacterized protein n=1 Tax=Acanthoscelides obtectus TaxID=200917 RepID=A0A9P0Q2N4_ACAOB|nr:unnamed protein product [Acanthoscelides obtectus]CAK1637305.1 hypothetical protein AOBTE_LOCUS9910 [Acanthoscelides obtectus]
MTQTFHVIFCRTNVPIEVRTKKRHSVSERHLIGRLTQAWQHLARMDSNVSSERLDQEKIGSGGYFGTTYAFLYDLLTKYDLSTYANSAAQITYTQHIFKKSPTSIQPWIDQKYTNHIEIITEFVKVMGLIHIIGMISYNTFGSSSASLPFPRSHLAPSVNSPYKYVPSSGASFIRSCLMISKSNVNLSMGIAYFLRIPK